VTKDQSCVTEGMQSCLLTTCKLLRIPRHFGQAVKAALLHKEEVATKVLSLVAETKYPGNNNLIVPVLPTSTKARKNVKALEGHIILLSEESLNAIDDIGQYHFPKKLQSVTFGETNIKYWFPSGMPAWNGLTKKPKH